MEKNGRMFGVAAAMTDARSVGKTLSLTRVRKRFTRDSKWRRSEDRPLHDPRGHDASCPYEEESGEEDLGFGFDDEEGVGIVAA